MEFDKYEHEPVIESIYKDVGHIRILLHELMDEQGISVNYMSKLTNIQHRIVKKYYDQRVSRADLEVLAKFCFVLGCDVEDVLHYEPPEIKEDCAASQNK